MGACKNYGPDKMPYERFTELNSRFETLLNSTPDVLQVQSLRDKFLECAPIILNLQHLMPTEKQPRLGGQVRIMRLLVQSFCATIVLYMDLYVNRTLGSETERKYEIQRALQIIEDAGAQSTAAANFIGTLMKILHKHRIRIQRDTLAEVSNVPNAGLLSWPRAEDSLDNRAGQNSSSDTDIPCVNLGFDEIWNSYFEVGVATAQQDWDALFYDLYLRFE
ncbi:hypothetical protein M433DRAFT_133278 [Acidomyces richmondensis BFW]|nr:hypothetical protein M433DRAFT_133278 [Acidomyces richmondensis BFW]